MKKIIYVMLCFPLLMTACKNDTEVDNPDSTPITLLASIGSVGVETRGDGVISDSYVSDLPVSFARIDQSAETGDYSSYSAASPLNAIRAGGDGPRSITFAMTQNYLSDATYNSSKFVGWYPRADFASGVVTFAIDGSTDIMLTNEVTGSSSAKFNTEERAFTFAHQLTQLQLKVYAESSKAVEEWGTITSVKVKNQNSVYTVTLPDQVAFAGDLADLSVKDANLPVTLPSGVAASAALGYVMIPPVASNGMLTLEIITSNGGTKEVTLTAPAEGMLASNAYVYTLRFAQTSIDMAGKAQVGAWITVASNNYEVDASTGALNLSSNGTANSYIARPNGIYKFKATVMGNGATTLASSISGQEAPSIVPATLSPTAAFVVWETGSSKGSVIEDGSLALANGYVTFRTTNTSTPGNAVIAVTDGTNILWSWHIWKVNYDPNAEYETYTTHAGRSFKMMKYNLGATETSNWSSTATNAGDLGLLYQWGRKDPFVGGFAWTTTPVDVTYASGYEYSTAANDVAGADADASVVYAVKNPTKLILGHSTTRDWLNATAYTAQRDNLWGNPNAAATQPNPMQGDKSIYDPCPPGWRVSSSDAFTRFTTTGANATASEEFNVATLTFDKGFKFYYTAMGSGLSSYYPAAGIRDGLTGDLAGVRTYGYCWSSSSTVGGNVNSSGLSFFASRVNPLSTNYRSHGFLVRCEQE